MVSMANSRGSVYFERFHCPVDFQCWVIILLRSYRRAGQGEAKDHQLFLKVVLKDHYDRQSSRRSIFQVSWHRRHSLEGG